MAAPLEGNKRIHQASTYGTASKRSRYNDGPPPHIAEAKACIDQLSQKATEINALFTDLTQRYPTIIQQPIFIANNLKVQSILQQCRNFTVQLTSDPINIANQILTQREEIVTSYLWLNTPELTTANIISLIDS